MKKEEVHIVIVVLAYRNTKDVYDFLENISTVLQCKYKTIIVNSYYDNNSYCELMKIAASYNNCDFISVENKGYGYGNNRGVKFAKENYKFRYLIISNPDIEIIKFPIKELEGLEEYILAPTIITSNGKNQNPYYYSNFEFVEWLMYKANKKEIKLIAYLGIAINKVYREVMLFYNKILHTNKIPIYAAHGSFIIFGIGALNKLGKIFNEKMFLYAEENHLAKLASKKNVIMLMLPSFEVKHKEDGSASFLGRKVMSNYARDSFITYYENWKNT